MGSRIRLGLVLQTVVFVVVVAMALSGVRPVLVVLLGAILWAVATFAVFSSASGADRRLDRLRRWLHMLRGGDFSERIPEAGNGPMARLEREANSMATELGQRFDEFNRERNQLEAILGSMQEGVLAIDRQERVLGINRTAETLLETTAAKAQGRLVQEVIRHADLQRYVARVLAGERTPEDEDGLTLQGVRNMVLRVRSAPLRDAEGREIGMLMLLADVTRLNRLETLRRDFAANVSHELRTPVASIKGYAETLLDGAVDEPGSAKRFVNIIYRQANRLEGLIEDLLSLTALENVKTVERDRIRVADMLGEALEVCSRTLREREAEVTVECPPDLHAVLNGRLVEQALINLIENAAKYGGPQARIAVAAAAEGQTLVLSVADQGAGIPAHHHERLFERFYRVDKARSRQAGGTGLGLAIVKHVATVHGGTAELQSAPGKGACFTLRLPAVGQ